MTAVAGGASASRRRRIAHICTRFVRGGAERNIEQVMLNELDRGAEVDLFLGAGSNPQLVPPDVRVQTIHDLRRSIRPIREVRALLAVRRLLRRGGYDVVHTHESKAGIIGRVAALGTGATVVHTVHMPSFGPAYGRVPSAVYKRLERMCGWWTDIFVVVGDELRELYLANGIGRPERFVIVRSPIAIADLAGIRSRTRADIATARRRLAIDEDRETIVSVGRLEPRKRHMLVVEQLAGLLSNGRQLVIAGEGPLHGQIEEVAARRGVAGAVHLVGHVDVRDVFEAADVLVHASSCEGVPQVVIQALAAGVPVVATDAEGLREVNDAKIRIVDRAASGLVAGVLATLGAPCTPVPIEALRPWTQRDIAASLQELVVREGL